MVFILTIVINEMDGGMKGRSESSVQCNNYSSCGINLSDGINWRSVCVHVRFVGDTILMLHTTHHVCVSLSFDYFVIKH